MADPRQVQGRADQRGCPVLTQPVGSTPGDGADQMIAKGNKEVVGVSHAETLSPATDTF
jgi:hypothetical protein